MLQQEIKMGRERKFVTVSIKISCTNVVPVCGNKSHKLFETKI